MAAGWSVMDALNKNSKAAAEDKPKARFRTRDISIKKMYSNDKNFYSMNDIEGLAQLILAVGMVENMAVTYDPCERGEYRIIAGERRWRALTFLTEKGYEDFEIATCQILTPAEEHEEVVQLIVANAYRTKTVMDILQEERQLKESLQYMKDNGLTLQGYKLDSGRLRDIIADIMKMSAAKIGQIEGINKCLIPEFTEELKEGRLTFSAAYELSGMSAEDQNEMFKRHKENGLTLKEVKDAKKQAEEEKKNEQLPGQMEYPKDYEDDEETEEEDGEEPEEEEGEQEQQEEWQQAHPESVTSICYSCLNYQECNVKTGTCQKCDQYIDKAEEEKTPEQRYEEEQAAIDKETARKLREKEQEEKMNNLPSDRTEQKYVRLSEEAFQDVAAGFRTYLILKNDRYKEGEILKALEFHNGKATGNEMTLEITCMDDDNTSSVLDEGYCVIGFRQQEKLNDGGTDAGAAAAAGAAQPVMRYGA